MPHVPKLFVVELFISPILILKSILFVPNLDCNLISVNKLNKDLNCETKFVANSCVFSGLGIREYD